MIFRFDHPLDWSMSRLLKMLSIHFLQESQFCVLNFPFRARRKKIEIGFLLQLSVSTNCRRLMRGREKRRPVVSWTAMARRGTDADKPGEILILGPKSIADPRAQGRSHEIV